MVKLNSKLSKKVSPVYITSFTLLLHNTSVLTIYYWFKHYKSGLDVNFFIVFLNWNVILLGAKKEYTVSLFKPVFGILYESKKIISL